MEINASGFAPKELVPNRANIEQELAQKSHEKDENVRQEPKLLEPRPVEQANGDKLRRIDIYV